MNAETDGAGATSPADPTLLVLSGPWSAESQAVLKMLEEVAPAHGLSVVRADENLTPGTRIVTAVAESIERAALVVAILDKNPSPNAWFELGLAAAAERPLLVIVTSDDVPLPFDVAQYFVIGPVLTSETLRRAVQRALKPSARPRSHRRVTGAPLGSGKADELVDEFRNLGAADSDRTYGAWFTAVLAAAQVPFDLDRRADVATGPDDRPGPLDRIDFVVTASELDGNLGNPLPVELKTRGWLDALVQPRLSAYASYLVATGATTVLLVAADGVDSPRILPVPGGLLLACSALDLVDAMRDSTFGAAVIRLRNQATHRQVEP